MNKADLGAKWGKYCDTNQLVDDMMQLLSANGHRNCESGVCKMLDTYFANKEPLIQLFANSNHYIGNMRISLVEEFDRQVSLNEIRNFFNMNRSLFEVDLYKNTDSEGKKMLAYLATGKMSIGIDGLNKSNPSIDKLRKFEYENGFTKESTRMQQGADCLFTCFRQNACTKADHNFDYTDYDKKSPVIKAGTKMSRAFNKVCVHYGIDKREGYNKAFAQYADLVSDLVRKMSFVISLNPLDYLTMSVGNSWHSCHHIQNGGYKGGCLSYMLDSTSIITFVIPNLDGKIHETPKYYRQMIHYNNNLFIQSRLYPQGNDGATNLYDKFRNIVMNEFNELLQCDGNWNSEIGYRTVGDHTGTDGIHYPDYLYNSSVTMFYPSSKADEIKDQVVHIGHNGICPHCGKKYTSGGRFSHDSCISD